MKLLNKGRYDARFAETDDDLSAAQTLRTLAFRAAGVPDADAYDADCKHVLITDHKSGTLVCCFRLMPIQNGQAIHRSYSAQYYELSGLSDFDGPMVEMGRFCIHPDWADPDILRVAWGAMTRFVDENGVEMLFGCSSFKGTSEQDYLDAFSLLRDRHLAPKRWLPRVKAPRIFSFGGKSGRKPDLKAAMKVMPPLLRSYLAMGGWVSDHAVVDDDLGTLHVFTGLEIRAIPPARARLLRTVAG
ncbi:GNAT family N-acetyltransferase [Litoreibacter roseus]|uniref:L-ornithine N(alpha)-acyltransferase n=1 Tax=Litoreibacter roseus TaxID=2601869 RepID=A0A6N6JC20_9RHOB|nr:GNAT family N-acetyltransferase [Litoreibacter roseus]GFE63624.1 ornithine-acyl-ACP acyltransferase [Litoreibacter roseus]